MDSKKEREAEIRKMVQQLNEKTRFLIEATASSAHLGIQLSQRIETLQDLKTAAEGLLNETMKVFSEESYEKNREMLSFCFSNMTNISAQLDSAIRNLRAGPSQ